MIVLPFPPSSLSGHAKGHWRAKAAETKKHRQWAHDATLAAFWPARPDFPATGDIRVRIQFVPPDMRSDRANFPNRTKAYLDGIAQALGVNDKRFVPAYEFLPAAAPGEVRVTLEAYAPGGAA